MKVLFATSEAVPFIKTGGLGDVIGALMNEYTEMGVETAVILPFYRKIKQAAEEFNIRPLNKEILIPLGDRFEAGKIWKGKTSKGASAYFIENDLFYDREELYGTPEGDYPDNVSRFTFYNRGVLETLKALELNVDVIHCNDWQTGLIPVYIKTLYKTACSGTSTLMTIHNLGYQGPFWSHDIQITGLGWELFNTENFIPDSKINFLKGGILFTDIITTVSSNYAREILTSEYGFGLEDVLRKRSEDIYGIINGIDYIEWNPEKDPFIPALYSREDLSGKDTCKKYLQKKYGFSVNDSPLIGMVTRFSSQKGLTLVAEAMEKIVRAGAQIIILGKGDESLQNIFSNLQKKYSGQLSVIISFDNPLAHKIYAGSDIFLMPSRYEPCGLGQLIAMRYGTIPVARRTGGLPDTIAEYDPSDGTGTGFLFSSHSFNELFETLQQAIHFYHDKKHWLKVQKNALSRDFSWHNSAEKYLSLYKKICKPELSDSLMKSLLTIPKVSKRL